MDYSKIKLENERNSHVTKRLNRLNTWNFFKVIYRDNIWRLFGFSLLMLICMAPIFGMQYYASYKISQLKLTLPNLNGFGFSTGTWTDLATYYAQQVAHLNLIYGLLTVAASLLTFVVFSGGFAVIRDAFWTGKLSVVGVFRSMGKGIAANWAYALGSVVIGAFGVFGVITFYKWGAVVMPVWLAIVLTVLLSMALLLVVCYLMIVCSVSVTYKQSFVRTLDDSWRLMWLNFLPNIVHLMLGLLPIALYFVFANGILQTIFLVLIFMFGGIYFPLVWQSFMMRTFALFHPVEPRKKKDVQREEAERAKAAAEARLARREAKNKKSASANNGKAKSEPKVTETAAEETVAEEPAEAVEEPAAEDPAPVEVAPEVAESAPEEETPAEAAPATDAEAE